MKRINVKSHKYLMKCCSGKTDPIIGGPKTQPIKKNIQAVIIEPLTPRFKTGLLRNLSIIST